MASRSSVVRPSWRRTSAGPGPQRARCETHPLSALPLRMFVEPVLDPCYEAANRKKGLTGLLSNAALEDFPVVRTACGTRRSRSCQTDSCIAIDGVQRSGLGEPGNA